MSYSLRRKKRNMSKFEEWANSSEPEKIKKFIGCLGYVCISDSSSKNQIYSKEGNTITIRDKIE